MGKEISKFNAMQKCDHCSSPLFAAVRCRVCGRVARPTVKQSLTVEHPEPAAPGPAEAMRLADDYASAQSQLDGEHFMPRKYYVESRDEARVKLAEYLGIKEEK